MEPICNLNLDNLQSRHELTERSILERLHVLDDLPELDKE